MLDIFTPRGLLFFFNGNLMFGNHGHKAIISANQGPGSEDISFPVGKFY